MVAIRDNEVVLLQCKADGKLPRAERDALGDLADRHDVKCVLAARKSRKLTYTDIFSIEAPDSDWDPKPWR